MRREHNSFADFVEFAANENVVTRHERHSRTTRSDSLRWTGTASFEDAVKLAREGWPEGRERIAKYSAQFAAMLGSRLRKPILSHSVAGFAPDVGAFLCGEPENMFNRETRDDDAPGKILSLVVNGGASASISPETIMRRGAMIVALIDALENAGYSCNLTVAYVATEGHSGSGAHGADLVQVKRAGEPVEIDRLAFIFAHPSMLRRIVFSAREQDAQWFNACHCDYGYSQDLPAEDQGDLYFPRSFTGDVSDRELLPWFIRQMAKVGITLQDA